MKTKSSKQYDLAMDEEIALMTPAEYLRWNPKSTDEEAKQKIKAAIECVRKTAGPLFN